MFEIDRDGTEVQVIAVTSYPLSGQRFPFSFNTGSEWAAKMLWHHILERQQAELRRVREEEYARGWKDAKAHATKAVWFSSGWKK